MPTHVDSEPGERLTELARAHDTSGLDEYIRSLEPSEAIRAILRLDPEHQDSVLTTLSPPEAADLIEDVPDEQAADLIEHLKPMDAASIVAEMQSDEQADLIADLGSADAAAILEALEPRLATDLRARADYADDVAGGLMITEYLSVPETATAAGTLEQLREHVARDDEFFARYAYVVSPMGALVGVVAASDLGVVPQGRQAGHIMRPALFASVDATLDELRDFFESHQMAAVPIVDERGRLIGIVRRTALLDALAARAERDMLRMRGIVGGEEVRTLPTITRSRRRLSWLSINVGLNVLAASVIAANLETLDAVIALAVFLPIISDMSGASGNQAVAVSMRELSLGLVRPREVGRVWLKELSVGSINGVVLGFLLGGVAWFWDGNPFLGLVVGLTLAINTVISVSIGGTVPLLLRRFNVDPAIASGPILTTVTDICGFFLALTLASLMLTRLV